MLWAYSQTTSDQIHLSKYAIPIDVGSSTGGREQSRQYRHGGSLSSSVVPQEGRDLSLVHVEGEVIHSYLTFTRGL